MRKNLLPALLVILVLAGTASGEQIRLRTGDFLQGEIQKEQADEEGFSFKLFRTGGVFRLRWDQLIEQDEKRYRDQLGLNPWDESEVPLIPGHQVTFYNGSVEVGVAENPDETDQPLRLLTATGKREYPRDAVAAIRKTLVEALEVYTPRQLVQLYLQEGAPETPGEHFEFAKRCMQVDAFAEAQEHLQAALADEGFMNTDDAMLAERLLDKVAVHIRAADAVDRKRLVKRLAFQKKWDQAIGDLNILRDEYRESPKILEILNLDRLQREIVSKRRKYFLSDVRRRFFKELDALIKQKIRERDENDETLGIKAIQQWASNPRGLTAEIFGTIAAATGLEENEAREFWDNRGKGQIHRFNYGGATFIHPEVRDRSRKALASSQQRKSGSRGSSRRRGAQPRGGQQVKLKTDTEWWERTRSADAKKNFVKAWFAEFSGGVLHVLRIETKLCRHCGGKGVKITSDAATAAEIRTPCTTCNLAGHERVVICR